MPQDASFKVVIFSSGSASHIGRLARRINQEAPHARVAGILSEQRPGKPLRARVLAFLRNLRDWEFVKYAAGRIVHGAVERVLAIFAIVIRFVHAYTSAPEPEENLDTICRSLNCQYLVTTDYHGQDALDFVRTLDADLGIVYGTRVLKPALFTIPCLGSINIHKRKVPDYRGGGPVGLWEMLDGQTEIGITVHEVTEKLDAGAVVNATTIPIEPFDTLNSLALKAHVVANDLLVRSVAEFATDRVVRSPQHGQGRMFKNPSPQLLAQYQKQLKARRPAFCAVRGRSAAKLFLRTVVGMPMTAARNWYRRLNGKFSVEILFHHIVTDRRHAMGISTEHFLRQIQFLRKFYNIVSLSEATEMLRKNSVKSPTVVLTFDDGYRDNFINLRAIREQIEIPMTLFVSTAPITDGTGFNHDLSKGRANFAPLTWHQVKQMYNEGFEMGSHTRTHFDCGSTDVARLENEIVGSKHELQRRLGEPVKFLSFPFGLPKNMSDAAMRIAAENYEHVLSAYGGSNIPSAKANVKHLQRWAHPNDVWELELMLQSLLELAPQKVDMPAGLELNAVFNPVE